MFVLAAALAGLVGVLVFDVVLSHALTSDVDSDLQVTARAFAGDVDNGVGDHRPARVDPNAVDDARRLSAVLAVFAPDGSLLAAQPEVLPADLYPGKAAASRSGFDTVTYAGEQIRRYRLPVPTPEGPGLVVVGQSLHALDDANADARQLLYVIVPIAVALSAVGAWLLSGAALRPVEQMRADAQRLSETAQRGQISTPATSDSLERLANTFNALLAQQQALLDRQRALVADAGHELRTPLAVLQTELDTADRPGRTREDLADSIAHARVETTRLATLAENLLLLAQSDGGQRVVRPELVDVVEVLVRASRGHRDQFAAVGVTLDTDIGSGSPVMAELDPAALARVLDNLLRNAIQHTPPGGAVRLRVRTTTHTIGADDIVVSVSDDGPGFPAEFLPHAFERFARADRSRGRSDPGAGTGLGLSIVAALVAAHGGTVTAGNRPEGGAVLTIVLPVEQRAGSDHLRDSNTTK